MRRTRVYLIVILALALTVTACGAQGTEGQLPESTLDVLESVSSFVPEVNLPPVVLRYNEQGVPSVLGLSTTNITAFTGVNLSVLELDPLFIDWFTRSNLQHIELEYRDDGLFVYANGELLPSIGWDSQSLNNAVEIAPMLGVQNTATLERLIPILQRLGLDLVLQFPVSSGSESIPLHQGEAAFPTVEGAGEGAPVIHLGLEYNENGLPSVMGLTSRDLSALTGLNLSFIELSEANISVLQALNLQTLGLETRPDGLYVLVNGQALPHLAYSPQQIDALVNLYVQLDMYPAYQAPPAFLRDILMLVQQADLEFMLQFPVEDGG